MGILKLARLAAARHSVVTDGSNSALAADDSRRRLWILLGVGALALLFVVLGAPGAQAQDAGQVTINNGCMNDVGGRNYGCTANDVSLANATNIVILDVTEEDPGCAFLGDTVSFTADFEVMLNAQARHDIGIWFDIAGDSEGDAARTGTCSVSTLNYEQDPPWLDLDGTTDNFAGTKNESGIQDTCGDINDDHNPLFPTITVTDALCVDNDGDGKLDLPYCTSWKQPGSNELCTGPLPEDGLIGPGGTGSSSGVTPGSPSKCKCDEGFNVDIEVPSAELQVVKTANPTSVNEPGGDVTFTVEVTNTGINPDNNVTLNSLIDDIHGDLNGQGDCSVPQTITGNGGTYTCSFTATVSGNAGDSETDTATASGVDDESNPVSGSDDATVTIADVQPAISVVKTANPISVDEPGGNVTFTVAVTNDSNAEDPVTITSLVDDIHLDLNGQGDCSVPQTIQPSATYTCSFTAFVAGNAAYTETDTATASGTDDEGNPVSAFDDATVTIVDVLPAISVVKTADPISVDEPGGDVTFTVAVTNDSNAEDPVTITSLVDDIHLDLDGQGDCSVPQTIQPSATYTCSFTAFVAGDGGDTETDTATASGTDDEGNPVSAFDDATVTILDVAPEAALTKTATQAVVTFEVVISNDSVTSDPLTVDSLLDDIYGDITSVQGDVLATGCATGVTIIPGDSYTCSFEGLVRGADAPQTDTVTGKVSDDEANSLTRSDTAFVDFN